MEEKLTQVENRYIELCDRAERPDFYADPKQAAKYLKEQRDLAPVVSAFRAWKRAKTEMQEALELMAAEPEMKDFCQEEYQSAKKEAERLEDELRILLLPKDPNDDKNVIVEIRGGVGGEESALFAHSLYRMYSMYAARRGWTLELLNYNETELGGVKEADFILSGSGAFSRMKYESGVHRVQRVPETESGGRIHTSTATVAVLPEAEDVEVEIDPGDLEIETIKSSGAGGQHVNKTESAIRLLHKSTGIVIECQDERSQFKNRDKAMKLLRAKLFDLKSREQNEKIASERRSQVGTGDRSERIRTYNFPQGRVTDHRIGLTIYSIETFIDGNIDSMIDALATAETAEKLKNGGGGA